MSDETEKALRPYPHYDVNDSDDEESQNLLRFHSLTKNRKSFVSSLPHIITLYATIAVLSILVIVLSIRQNHYDPSLGVWCRLTYIP
jgi:hypothetical protein